jgi:hypothetical protein
MKNTRLNPIQQASKLFLIVLLFVSSCGEKVVTDKNKKEGILSVDKMVELMVDIQLADAAADWQGKTANEKKKKTEEYYSAVLQKHQLSREDFETSLDFYLLHPEEFEEIYKNVITELSKMQSEK